MAKAEHEWRIENFDSDTTIAEIEASISGHHRNQVFTKAMEHANARVERDQHLVRHTWLVLIPATAPVCPEPTWPRMPLVEPHSPP